MWRGGWLGCKWRGGGVGFKWRGGLFGREWKGEGLCCKWKGEGGVGCGWRNRDCVVTRGSWIEIVSGGMGG